MDKGQLKNKSGKVSHETSAASAEGAVENKYVSWKEAMCRLGVWNSGWIFGPSARLFRSIWDSLINEFSSHGYTELILNGESNQFSDFLKWMLYAEEKGLDSNKLPIQYICQQSKYSASVQAVFKEENAEEWIEKTSADMERFLFQLNVPYRINREPQTADGGFRSQWRLDLWLPEEQEYLELCSIGCEKQDLFKFHTVDTFENIWIGKIEELSGRNLFLAVAENGYDKMGRIKIPAILVPYMMAEWIP